MQQQISKKHSVSGDARPAGIVMERTYFVRISLAHVTFLSGAAVNAMPSRMTTNETSVSSVIYPIQPVEDKRRGGKCCAKGHATAPRRGAYV